MRTDNIFITGGEVSGEHMIGYKDKIEAFTRMIDQKLSATGGIYLYGLYRMGKTSVAKQSLKRLQDVHPNLLCIYMNLNIFNTNSENRFNSFLEAIIIELEELLEESDDPTMERVMKKIADFKMTDKSEQSYRIKFNKVFTWIKKASRTVLLMIDEFDAARDVFSCKADFELFRELVASPNYSVCLVTISRQELSMIEHENPNNSSFKGVMYPYTIKGFTEADIDEYCRIMMEYYDYDLSRSDIDLIQAYCGSSPYLWSCVGYELAEKQLLNSSDFSVEDILNMPAILSKIGGYHDSILKCLTHDRDENDISLADKLVSAIIGPSYLATDEDIKLLIGMNYLIDTGETCLAFSQAFKKYLLNMTYNNDVLNNFETLEKKLKNLLEVHKSELFQTLFANSSQDENLKWFAVLSDVWKTLEHKTFDKSNYENQIRNTNHKFSAHETALNVMSLEDVTRILRMHWTIFSSHFHNQPLSQWETHLKACGRARNPVHHGSIERIYSKEKQKRVNSYCLEIIKEVS